MKRFQSVSRVALVGAATAALLLGGVGPAFAVGNEGNAAEVELTTEVQPEVVTPSEEEGAADADASLEVDAATEPAERSYAPEAPETAGAPEATELFESDGDITYTEFSAGSAPQLNPDGTPVPQGETLAGGTASASSIWTGPRRKVSGKVTLPAGAPQGWMSQINVGADCTSANAGGGCGYDIKFNRTTGAFTMSVPVARAGWKIVPGAYAYNPKGQPANLVQQSWGTNCGVGVGKATPAGTGELKNVNLPMCLGATITGKVTDPKADPSKPVYYYIYAFVGGEFTRYKGFALVTPGSESYSVNQIPRVKDVVVMLSGGQNTAEQLWKNTYDVKRATPINTTGGSAAGIDFTVRPGFSDMCAVWTYCNKFYNEIMWMHDAGISTGFQVTQFGQTYRNYAPKQAVTREAMSAFLYRISDRTGYKASKTPRFVDVNKNHKFYAQIQWMGDMGISTGTVRNGKRYYDPSQGVTREAMSAFLYRMDKGAGPALTKTPRFVDVNKNHKFYAQIQWMGDRGISTGTTRNGKAYYDPSDKVTREAMSAFLYRFDS